MGAIQSSIFRGGMFTVPYFVLLVVIFAPLWFISCKNNRPMPLRKTDLEVSACLVETDIATLDIMTWNVRTFPMDSARTIDQLAYIIKQQDPDVIAFQEISTNAVLSELLNKLSGWEGFLHVSGDLNLGFIYKISEVSMVSGPEILFEDDYENFQRPPLVINLRHRTGIEWILINVHLKCCSGEENELKRRKAAEKLKMYIDEYHHDDPLMVLGDFNGPIAGVSDSDNVFIDFVNDTVNYRFADMEIARGSATDWSYPAWPSHIDHILITDELFDHIYETVTLPYDQCDGRYFNTISDHRAIMVRMK